MAEDIKKNAEISDEDLEQVSGGYTAGELATSRSLADKDYSCPIEKINQLVRKLRGE